ncbi:hypothetical protein DVA86_19805 [Streptomyces armeniacus]|uniref:Uncharacterized protein n=1 Tax=Streptomyces armeniacus TaxID=83291 RepID=A0A345XSE0_9ACTN|nr:hypothetical protein [Streptomyces armeniacus]AXK34556.1 hypothetical protein DVA86_19805 [Streptomyces armeniacus]
MAAADGGTGGGSGAGTGGGSGGEAQPPPEVRIGTANNSAFNFGAHGTANTTNVTDAAPQDAAQHELLEAVHALRQDLERFVATEDTRVLDAELVAAEEEIGTSGAASRTRLERLRDALAAAGTAVTALGSGAAVGESVAALLRG